MSDEENARESNRNQTVDGARVFIASQTICNWLSLSSRCYCNTIFLFVCLFDRHWPSLCLWKSKIEPLSTTVTMMATLPFNSFYSSLQFVFSLLFVFPFPFSISFAQLIAFLFTRARFCACTQHANLVRRLQFKMRNLAQTQLHSFVFCISLVEFYFPTAKFADNFK